MKGCLGLERMGLCGVMPEGYGFFWGGGGNILKSIVLMVTPEATELYSLNCQIVWRWELHLDKTLKKKSQFRWSARSSERPW